MCGAFGFCSTREKGEGMTHLQTATGHIGGGEGEGGRGMYSSEGR